jgi:hypothetical protein
VNERVYQHNDVYTTAGRTGGYLETIGTFMRRPERSEELVGTFSQLHVAGTWPRAVNLWESTWPAIVGALHEHDTPAAASISPETDEWIRRSAAQRTGGFDRYLSPGPGCPDLAGLRDASADDTPRPCLVQLDVSLRADVKHEYVQWFADECVEAARVERWQAWMWFSCLHGERAFVYFAAPSWDGLDRLADALPRPRQEWGASTRTSLLEAWSASSYLEPA